MSQTKAQLVGGVGISTVGDLSVYGGVNATGIVTATSFYGGSATITGNVSIAGTLTYEDVTNVDSVGVITARSGVRVTGGTVVVGSGVTVSSGGLNIAGVTTVSAGSASAPSITPSGDNNTGIFFPAADTIAFAEGGVEALRINSSANIGIGTTNPSQKLEVVGGEIKAGRVDTSQEGGQVSFGKATDNTTAWYIDVYGSTSTPSLRFVDVTAAAIRATMSSSGGFSLGTTADPGAGAIYATGDITAFYSSDIRLKKDIQPISEPIKKLMEISGVTYKWNEEYLKDKDVDGYFVRETEVGVIAQEVEKVLPEVVATRENGYKAVRYEKLVALLIEAVKDQQKQIDELKARLEEN